MPGTDFNQLSKIPFLIEHYNLHQQEAEINGTSFNVFDFIYIHYIFPDDHTHDQPIDHGELPLKSVSSSLIVFDCYQSDDLTVSSDIHVRNVSGFIKFSDRLISNSQFRPPPIV